MDPSILAPWRDLSIIWLAILTGIVFLVPGVALFYALRGIRAVKRRLRLPLLNAQLWALRIQYGTQRASDTIIRLPVQLHSRAAQVRVTLRGGIDYLRGA